MLCLKQRTRSSSSVTTWERTWNLQTEHLVCTLSILSTITQMSKLTLNHSLKLKQFKKFESAASALEEVSSLIEGKVTPLLASLLDSVKDEKKAVLAVADKQLGRSFTSVIHPILTVFRAVDKQATGHHNPANIRFLHS